MNRLTQLLMNRACIAVWLAGFCCFAESRGDKGRAVLDAIQNDYHKYVDIVKEKSVRMSLSVSLNGDDKMGATQEGITDRQNALWQYVVLYDNYALQRKSRDQSSLASISRIRGSYRQSFGLRRATPTSAWVLTRDTSERLTKDNENLSSLIDEEGIGRLPQLEAMRCAPGYLLTTIPQLITRPGLRLGSITEDRTGAEPIVTMEFTIDPPLDRKAARVTFVGAGRMQLRPDAYWTLKSGTVQLQSASPAGKIVQCTVTNTFHEDSEKKSLPKEVKCVATVITDEGEKAEEIRRATFEFSTHMKVPEERLSLTQFGLSEREPVDAAQGEPEPEPSRLAERIAANRLAAGYAYSVPLYLWLTGAGVLLLVIGIALRVWLTRSAKRPDAAVPPPTAPG